MKTVEAIFDGEVLRTLEPLLLESGTRVLLQLEVIDTPYPAKPPDAEHLSDPVMFDENRATFLVIDDSDDLDELAINQWPKPGAGSGPQITRRTPRAAPPKPHAFEDNDLLIMDDDEV